MSQNTAEKGSRLGIAVALALAFVLIKVLMFSVSSELLRHFGVACVLLLIPALESGVRNFDFFRNLLMPARHSAGLLFCSLYAIIPLLIIVLFMNNQWPSVRLDFGRWVFSQAGFAAVFLAPIVEEFYFRGWLLSFQLRNSKPSEAVATVPFALRSRLDICYFNALVFWIFHVPINADTFSRGQFQASPGPFMLGFVAAWLTVMTGTPRAALVFHALANAMGPFWMPLLNNSNLKSVFYF